MRFWNEARVRLYGAMQRRLPAAVRNWVANSYVTARARDLLLRPEAGLVTSNVNFEGREFRFSAPVKESAAIRRSGGIENRLCRLVLAECGDASVAFDVGANYGFVTLVMAHAVGVSGRVVSFEADPSIYEAFRGNVTANPQLATRCTPVLGFVGDEARAASHITVDDYVRDRGIDKLDFLKIDVDGPDLNVLLGARNSLERFHPVVAIEMSANQDAIMSVLTDLGYLCVDMSGRDVDRRDWPPNVLAAFGRRLEVPRRSRR